MANLWRGGSTIDGETDWSPTALPPHETAVDAARLIRSEQDRWVLLAPSTVFVNGAPLDLGIRVLRDRDELRAGPERAFFSAEFLAAIEPFPGADRRTPCPRCTREIGPPGTPAVRCPHCGVWHHESPGERLPCFSYTPACAACHQPTSLDAEFCWTPRGL